MADGDYERRFGREEELKRLSSAMERLRKAKSLPGKKKAVVLGMGASGKAAAALLAKEGYEVSSLDESAKPSPEDVARAFDGTALAIVSPGVALSHPWLEECRARAIPFKSELELGVENLKKRQVKMIAVTGSKGKSSVVKLLAEALGGVACGNYGLPVSAVGECAWAVVEVSSFQLETTNLGADAFEAAAILNLQADHLDRHGSIETYHALKRKLLKMARVAFECAAPRFDGLEGALVGTYFEKGPLRLNGEIAIALLKAVGTDDDAIRSALASFRPLPHRMNEIGQICGVGYIDDSKATSIAALIAGVLMSPPGTRLIAGGLSKGDDPKDAISALTKRVKKVYTIGRSAEMFFEAWRGVVDCEVCGTLARAVESARSDAAEGDTILLSPGAASYDQFKNFGERGDVFAQLARKGKVK